MQSHALAYQEIYRPAPLQGTYAGTSYLSSKERGDDLAPACVMRNHEYSLPELILSYGKLASAWNCGVSLLEAGLANCDDRGELGNAMLCGGCFRSTEHAYRAYALRQNWAEDHIYELRHILLGEQTNLKNMLPWVEKDERQGIHGEASCRMFAPETIQAKLTFLENRLRDLDSKAE